MTEYALGITYDGSSFHGWQRQPELPTVQAALEQALSQVANSAVTVGVAGRTDTGVHATGQVAGFKSEAARSINDWQRGLNALTPDSIRVNWVSVVSPGFHPRYSAVARRYIYLFHDDEHHHPHLRGHVWQCPVLDADAMHRAAQHLVGEHDFSSFRGAGCQSLTPMRRVNRIAVTRRGRWVLMDVEANAFVLHMVRNIARALHDVGAGGDLDVARLLLAADRRLLGATAPPDGLYFAKVVYPDVALPPPAPIPFVGRIEGLQEFLPVP